MPIIDPSFSFPFDDALMSVKLRLRSHIERGIKEHNERVLKAREERDKKVAAESAATSNEEKKSSSSRRSSLVSQSRWTHADEEPLLSCDKIFSEYWRSMGLYLSVCADDGPMYMPLPARSSFESGPDSIFNLALRDEDSRAAHNDCVLGIMKMNTSKTK